MSELIGFLQKFEVQMNKRVDIRTA